MTTRVSILVVVDAERSGDALRALEGARAQEGQPQLLLLGEERILDALPAEQLEGVVRVAADGLSPAELRHAGLARAKGQVVLWLEPGERLAADALQRHLAALDEDRTLVASYGRTAVHDGARVRLRPQHGRGGAPLESLVQDKHLLSSDACLAWRRSALGETPFAEDLTAPAALRLRLALDLARQGGQFAFHPAVVAEADYRRPGLVEQEELVRVFLGLLYGPVPLEAEGLEARVRRRLARHLVAVGKQHYRGGDHRRAGAFFDEAVRAAPAYFQGRRYQFLNFIKRKVSGRARED